MPVGFPNVELRHRMQMAGAASGALYLDDVFFRALPPLTDPHWNVVLPLKSSWRYSSAVPTGVWYATNFADTAWSAGVAKFGAGSGPTNIVTTVPPSMPSYYFRKTFTVNDPLFEELLLQANCTDDFGGRTYPLRVWLNGKEIVTSGIDAVSSDGNETKYYDLTLFQHLLVPGTNTIAVQLNNVWAATWDNVSFDVGLIGVPSLFNAIELLSVQRTLTNALLQISAPVGTSLRIESRDSSGGQWQFAGSLSATAPVVTFSDTGQNGRLSPVQVSSRYYRVIGN
jgi:hypothetical protein